MTMFEDMSRRGFLRAGAVAGAGSLAGGLGLITLGPVSQAVAETGPVLEINPLGSAAAGDGPARKAGPLAGS
mgnify:CR=1 FL=1